MNTKGKPLVLRMTKRTRQTLMGAALVGWVLYLGAKFFAWYFGPDGPSRLQGYPGGGGYQGACGGVRRFDGSGRGVGRR